MHLSRSYTFTSSLTVERKATLFKKQFLRTSSETELLDAVTSEISSAMKKVLEVERNRASESILTSHQKLQ